MRVTSKGQVTIPKRIREEVELLPGTEVEWTVQGSGVAVLRRVPNAADRSRCVRELRAYLDQMRGTLQLGMSTDEYMEWLRGPYEDLTGEPSDQGNAE